VSDEAAAGGTQGVASNAAWLMAAELVGKVASFVLVVILARGLGPRQYGYFAFTLAFLPLFLHLARWGIDVATLRHISLRRHEFSPVFVNGAVLRVALAVIATMVALALAPLFVDNRTAFAVAVVVGAALLLDELAAYLAVAFTAFEQMRFNAAIVIANRVVSTALAGVVVALDGGLLAVCTAYMLGSLGAVLVGWSFLRRRLPPVHGGDLRRAKLGALLREGTPYGIANFLNMAVFRIDTVLLEALKGPVAVGIYGVAYRFFEPILFVTWSIAQAVTPRLVRDATDEAAPTRTFELSLAATLAFYLPVAAGAPFTAAWLLETLFGTRYLGAEDAVLWLAAAAVPYGVAHLARMAAVAAGARRAITAVAGGALALNVVLNLVLIPDHGVTGAAAATFVTEVLECGLLLGLYVRRTASLPVSGTVVAPAVAAVCMVVVLWPTFRGLGALLVGPVVFVAALTAVTRLVAPGDMRALVHAVRPGVG
jgi:O-antigen/teichoic acid export membrane protein